MSLATTNDSSRIGIETHLFTNRQPSLGLVYMYRHCSSIERSDTFHLSLSLSPFHSQYVITHAAFTADAERQKRKEREFAENFAEDFAGVAVSQG